MNTKVMFSSQTDQWATPQKFFDELNHEFDFQLDVCADESNHKCAVYYNKEQDGLSQVWEGICWCNPPYGKEIRKWIQKAAESASDSTTVVMLIPARTDTRWFHDYIYRKPNVEIRFVKGRLKFGDAKSPAPFPSMVVVFKGTSDSTDSGLCSK